MTSVRLHKRQRYSSSLHRGTAPSVHKRGVALRQPLCCSTTSIRQWLSRRNKLMPTCSTDPERYNICAFLSQVWLDKRLFRVITGVGATYRTTVHFDKGRRRGYSVRCLGFSREQSGASASTRRTRAGEPYCCG